MIGMSARFLAAYRVKRPADFAVPPTKPPCVGRPISWLVVYAAPNGLEPSAVGSSRFRGKGGLRRGPQPLEADAPRSSSACRWPNCRRGCDLIVIIPRAGAKLPRLPTCKGALVRLGAARAAKKSAAAASRKRPAFLTAPSSEC